MVGPGEQCVPANRRTTLALRQRLVVGPVRQHMPTTNSRTAHRVRQRLVVGPDRQELPTAAIRRHADPLTPIFLAPQYPYISWISLILLGGRYFSRINHLLCFWHKCVQPGWSRTGHLEKNQHSQLWHLNCYNASTMLATANQNGGLCGNALLGCPFSPAFNPRSNCEGKCNLVVCYLMPKNSCTARGASRVRGGWPSSSRARSASAARWAMRRLRAATLQLAACCCRCLHGAGRRRPWWLIGGARGVDRR